jgi:splicing factor U2AF subunit
MELIDFFNTIMVNSGAVAQKGNPVVSATINREKAYAFIEFRTTDEASVGMSLDGITFQTHSLRVRRPKDYMDEEGTSFVAH